MLREDFNGARREGQDPISGEAYVLRPPRGEINWVNPGDVGQDYQRIGHHTALEG